jgi:hypothetical protein
MQFKDWNALLQKRGPKILYHYIRTNTKVHMGSHEIGDWEHLKAQFNDL